MSFWSLLAGIVLALSSVPTWTQYRCDPLLVLIEGGSASSDGLSMERLARDLFDSYTTQHRTTVVSIDNGYFFEPKWWSLWTIPYAGEEEEKDMGIVADTIQESGHWPVVVVGHSLGGSTAYDIATMATISLLVTLDAVSTPDDVPSLDAPWINVYAINKWGHGDSIGEDWEYERNADWNVGMENTSHSAVSSMFKRAENVILDSLHKCDRPDHVEETLDLRFVTGLCRNDLINCAYAAYLFEKMKRWIAPFALDCLRPSLGARRVTAVRAADVDDQGAVSSSRAMGPRFAVVTEVRLAFLHGWSQPLCHRFDVAWADAAAAADDFRA